MKKDDDDFHHEMMERMAQARDHEAPHIERGADDLRFATGENQWPETERALRESEGRPCLTFNGLTQYIRQVTGQIRALNPAVKVSPGDGQASKETAEIIEGLVRQIEYQSDAASVYEAAAESAAACSIGHWRIRNDYCDGPTFEQEIKIERIFNPFSVFYDPQAKEPTRSDARFAFVVEEMDKEAFEAAYPDADPVDFTSDHKIPNFMQWATAETVTVAEYYWIEFEEFEIGLTAAGQIVKNPAPPLMFTKKRTVKEPRVKWAKVTGKEVLEGPTDIPGRYIPIVAVTGEEFHIGEETYRSSVIRFAKDAQTIYNVAMTAEAEVVMMQPRAPYMVTAKQIAGLETFWNEANSTNRPYLPYNPDPAAPAPMRIPPPVPSGGLIALAQAAADDMKRTTGIYDASLGARSNETSGKAIRERKLESQNSTSIYADNMVKAVAHTGRILVEMIPQVYDTKRAVRILGEDKQEKVVVINDLMLDQNGVVPVNDLKVGKYAVRIGVGPSYSSKRQEASEGMMDFLRAVPQASVVTADIIAGAQDWPDSDRIAERLRKTLPPGLAEPDEDPTPEQQQMAQQAQQQAAMQAQAQQQAQQIEARTAAAKATEAEADAAKAQAEAQLKQYELAQVSGQINAMIQHGIAQALQGAMAPMGLQPMAQQPF